MSYSKKKARIEKSKEVKANAKAAKKEAFDQMLRNTIPETIIYNVFGSPSENDVDILISVAKEVTLFPDHYLIRLRYLYSQEFENSDVNLIYIENGIVTWVAHGSAWETNNALFHTYKLHEQKFPCLVNECIYPTLYDINKKIYRTSRTILSLYTLSNEYSEDAKKGLSYTSSLRQRLEIINNIDAKKNTWRPDRNDPEIIKYKTKSACYQMLQVLAMLNGKEFYTKDELANYCPNAKPFLFRNFTDEDLYKLNIILLDFVMSVYACECVDLLTTEANLDSR